MADKFTRPDGTPIAEINWAAPTKNTDGSDITDELTYTLYAKGSAASALFEPLSSFPGNLNPDGSYSYPLADVAAFTAPDTYELYLTATDESGDESAPSNSIQIVRTPTIPNSPTAFSAA